MFPATSSPPSSSTTCPVATVLPKPPTVNLPSATSPPTSPSTSTVSLHLRNIFSKIKSHKTDPFAIAIVAIFKKYPNTAIALVIEPDSLPNLVTNIDEQACKDSASGYREGVAYALKALNLPNIIMYIDAGHGGWLGWNDNLSTSSFHFPLSSSPFLPSSLPSPLPLFPPYTHITNTNAPRKQSPVPKN